MSDLTGQSLDRYHILEQLGEGGMATVYKAYDTRLETDVAIKVIRTETIPPNLLEKSLKRFEREAKSLAKLTHPNIVKVMDYGEFRGKPYLVMPYLPGGTLKSKLKGKSMPWHEAVQILTPIANALAYAHKHNIIHRDIKPSNILITENGQPMLVDFGVAKILGAEETMELTGTGVGIGTPDYMAPEQSSSKTVDHRIDIYALGVVFYEMVTGRKPFIADTPLAVIIKHANEPLPRPKQFVSTLPQAVENIIIKALSREPNNRYQNMGEFIAALDKVAKNEAGTKAHKAEEAQPSQRMKLMFWLAGSAVVIALIGYSLFKLFPRTSTDATTSPDNGMQTQTVMPSSQTVTVSPPTRQTPKPTSTPLPTATPIFTEGEILFEDNFEDGIANGWQFVEGQQWEVTKIEDGNNVLKVTTPQERKPAWAITGDSTWLNYSLQMMLNIASPDKKGAYGLDLNVRIFNPAGLPRYNYQVNFDGYTEWKSGRGGIHKFSKGVWSDDLSGFSLPIEPNHWHEFKIVVFNDLVAVYLDSVLMGKYVDPEPLSGGQIVLAPGEGHPGQVTYFDDVKIIALFENP